MTGPITLDGRKFVSFSADSLAADQEIYILGHLRRAGAGEVLRGPDGVKYTAEQRAEETLTRLFLSGKTHSVLAGCLTEQGKMWNRADADANAVRFAAITDVEEKTVMRSLITRLVIGFCLMDGASSETLRN
ncbi:MAG: hypothetical protein WBF09_08850 [Candidatus Acidiferrum sp.]